MVFSHAMTSLVSSVLIFETLIFIAYTKDTLILKAWAWNINYEIFGTFSCSCAQVWR